MYIWRMLIHQGTAAVKKVITGIYTGLTLMQESAYPVCKDFLELIPKSLYSSLQHIIVQLEHKQSDNYIMRMRL